MNFDPAAAAQFNLKTHAMIRYVILQSCRVMRCNRRDVLLASDVHATLQSCGIPQTVVFSRKRARAETVVTYDALSGCDLERNMSSPEVTRRHHLLNGADCMETVVKWKGHTSCVLTLLLEHMWRVLKGRPWDAESRDQETMFVRNLVKDFDAVRKSKWGGAADVTGLLMDTHSMKCADNFKKSHDDTDQVLTNPEAHTVAFLLHTEKDYLTRGYVLLARTTPKDVLYNEVFRFDTVMNETIVTLLESLPRTAAEVSATVSGTMNLFDETPELKVRLVSADPCDPFTCAEALLGIGGALILQSEFECAKKLHKVFLGMAISSDVALPPSVRRRAGLLCGEMTARLGPVFSIEVAKTVRESLWSAHPSNEVRNLSREVGAWSILEGIGSLEALLECVRGILITDEGMGFARRAVTTCWARSFRRLTDRGEVKAEIRDIMSDVVTFSTCEILYTFL